MTSLNTSPRKTVAVIGGGPAGLMAAEVLSQRGVHVDVYDAMPSVGRKFLMAGKGGMNITHAEPLQSFLDRYGARREYIKPVLDVFSPDALREWIHGLGIGQRILGQESLAISNAGARAMRRSLRDDPLPDNFFTPCYL